MNSRRLLATVLFAAALPLAGCADENDPKTWVKRLDDPVTRVQAIKRLGEFFNSAMEKGGNDRESAQVKALLEVAAEPLAKTYAGVALDEKTRIDTMRILADMSTPQANVAYTKALADYEMGKNDEDAKLAAEAATRIAKTGKLQDQALIDGVWNAFSKHQVARVKLIQVKTALEEAVHTVRHASYGPKALEKLTSPMLKREDPDQLFWQVNSARLIGELKFEPAAKQLVIVMLSPNKDDIRGAARVALLRMPKAGETALVAAADGKDADAKKLMEASEPARYVPVLGEALAYLSRPAAHDAYIRMIEKADNDTTRTALAALITHFPRDKKNQDAFMAAYNKVAPDTLVPLAGGNGHAVMVQSSAQFYDPALTPWVLKEWAGAKGENRDAMTPAAADAAMKMMNASQTRAVGDQVAAIPGAAVEKEVFKVASGVVEKCKEAAACYVAKLDEPVPTDKAADRFGHIKAAYMATIYGDAKTKTEIAARIGKMKDPGVRLAMAEALDKLSPQGDAAIADQLDKMVEADKASGNKPLIGVNDSVSKVALKLRSRATQ